MGISRMQRSWSPATRRKMLLLPHPAAYIVFCPGKRTRALQGCNPPGIPGLTVVIGCGLLPGCRARAVSFPITFVTMPQKIRFFPLHFNGLGLSARGDADDENTLTACYSWLVHSIRFERSEMAATFFVTCGKAQGTDRRTPRSESGVNDFCFPSNRLRSPELVSGPPTDSIILHCAPARISAPRSSGQPLPGLFSCFPNSATPAGTCPEAPGLFGSPATHIQ